jgi:RNA polymerase primary sigma factor
MAGTTGGDMVTHWLEQAGRHPLLTAAEELHLGGLIRAWQDWEPSADEAPSAVKRRGLRARDRMVTANLRLVAHVCKKARPGLGVHVADADLPDLLQAGAIGLQRGVEKFDPTRGYKLSTYAYWWIRQGISRHIDDRGRTIRIPTTHSGTIAKAGKAAAALAAELGRTPTRAELAIVLEVNQDELERLLLVSAGCHSLDSPLPGDRDGNPSTLCDMLAAADGAESPDPLREQLLALLEHLDARSQRLIRAHYGLDESVTGIHELARREGISAHRVRNALKLAEYRLRKLSGVDPAAAVRPTVPGPIPDVEERADQLGLL